MLSKMQTLQRLLKIYTDLSNSAINIKRSNLARMREKKSAQFDKSISKKSGDKISAFFRRASALLTKLLTPPAENRHRQRYRTY